MIIVFLFQTYAQISSDICNENSLKTRDPLEVDEITPKLLGSDCHTDQHKTTCDNSCASCKGTQ
jgi:hypothetical protein